MYQLYTCGRLPICMSKDQGNPWICFKTKGFSENTIYCEFFGDLIQWMTEVGIHVKPQQGILGLQIISDLEPSKNRVSPEYVS